MPNAGQNQRQSKHRSISPGGLRRRNKAGKRSKARVCTLRLSLCTAPLAVDDIARADFFAHAAQFCRRFASTVRQPARRLDDVVNRDPRAFRCDDVANQCAASACGGRLVCGPSAKTAHALSAMPPAESVHYQQQRDRSAIPLRLVSFTFLLWASPDPFDDALDATAGPPRDPGSGYLRLGSDE